MNARASLLRFGHYPTKLFGRSPPGFPTPKIHQELSGKGDNCPSSCARMRFGIVENESPFFHQVVVRLVEQKRHDNSTNSVRNRRFPALIILKSDRLSPDELTPPVTKTAQANLARSICQAWHSDPLQCPKCQNEMRLIALIEEPLVIEKILRHLSLWGGRPNSR